MKTNVQTMRVSEVVSNEFKSAEIHLVSEIDFTKISPLELLQSGGTKKAIMFLRNLGSSDVVEKVKTKLLNQTINVCEYRFEVGELFEGKSSIVQSITDENGNKTVSTFTQLVENMPCSADFQPSETDIENAKSSLIAQAERRISAGTYELK